MIFKCGLTQEELDAKKLAEELHITAMKEWHDHFAWLPVEVEKGKCVWLESIERRAVCFRKSYGVIRPSLWEYREKAK